MKTLGKFDPDVQMFVEGPREPSPEHLGFLKWLLEQGRLVSPRKVDAEFAQAERPQ